MQFNVDRGKSIPESGEAIEIGVTNLIAR